MLLRARGRLASSSLSVRRGPPPVLSRAFLRVPAASGLDLDAIEHALRSQPRARMQPKPAQRGRASVLIPLVNIGNERSILFTKRSRNLSSHGGEVGFPGGKADKQDGGDLALTALRETHEETGLEPGSIRVLGMSNDALSLTGIAVTPVVGFVKGSFPHEADLISRLQLEPNEVEQAFVLPLRQLVDPALSVPDAWMTTRKTKRYMGGPFVIWGLTAWFLERLLPTLKLKAVTQADN